MRGRRRRRIRLPSGDHGTRNHATLVQLPLSATAARLLDGDDRRAEARGSRDLALRPAFETSQQAAAGYVARFLRKQGEPEGGLAHG